MKIKKYTLLIGLLMASSIQSIYAQTQKGWDSFFKGDIEKAISRFEKKAIDGDINAAFVTGMLYLDESSETYNIEQATQWLKSASDKGSGQASYNLFVLNYDQVLSETAAITKGYLEKSAEQNLAQAHIFLSMLYSNSNPLFGNEEPVYTKVAEHSLKAYELEKSPLTHFLVGSIYAMNDKFNFGVKQDTALGVSHLEKAFDGGLIVAAIALYDIYSKGEVMAPNLELAAKYKEIVDEEFANFFAFSTELNTPRLLSIYALLDAKQLTSILNKLEKDAKKGSAIASYQLAQIYYNGTPHIERNPEEALHYLEQAASLQNPKAMYELYERADFANKLEYLPYLKQAAQQDYMPALMRLANYYRTSYDEGVERSDALVYYIKAADLGNAEAMLELAGLYAYGDYYLDLDQDLEEAIKWYTLAIEKQTNNIQAYKNLANIYLSKSTPENITKAYELINQAYALDSKDQGVLAVLAKIYSIKESEYRDIHKAIKIYESLLANSDLDKRLETEYNYVLGLLYINDELGDKKEYAKAFGCFTEVLKVEKHAVAYFNIAEIYRLGLGGFAIDLEKAKENYRLANDNYYNQYYQELINLQLASILIASNDPGEQEEAIQLYIRLQSNDSDKYHFADVILANLQFHSSQEWLYDTYRRTKSPEYLKHITDGAKSGILGLQYYKALLDYTTDKNKGLQELIKLADKKYIPALRKLSDWSDGEQEIKWKIKTAALTNNDSDIYEVLDTYRSKNNYKEVLIWSEKLKDPDYSFSKSRVKEAIEKLVELKELEERVKANDADALYILAVALQRGMYGTVNKVRAKQLLEKAADLEHTESQVMLAEMYANSEKESDQQISTNYFIKAANNGDHSAVIEVGKRYINGIGVAENREKAKEYFFKAEQLEPNYLGSFYIRIMRNYDSLVEQLQDSNIEDKNPIWWKLRGYLKEGSAVRKDEKRANYILHQLAKNGYSEAQVELGENYATGKGVEQDWEKAAHYLRLSQNPDNNILKIYDDYVVPASQGDTSAKLNLGKTYLDRSAFYENPVLEKEAYELIKEAADSGLKEAQYEMYALYNSNKLSAGSQEETDSKAQEWLNKAIENNYAKAAAALANKYMRIGIPNASQEETDLEIKKLYAQAARIDSNYTMELVNFYLNRKMKIDKAIELLESIASGESSSAFLQLARIYETERYGKQDLSQAKAYYEKLVALGYLDYKINIADLYIRGDQHLQRSQDTALEYYAQALENALSDRNKSNFRLDEIAPYYENIGDGLFYGRNNFDKDIESSIAWYTKAAELGNKDAQEQLFKHYKKQREYTKSYFYGKLSVYDYELESVSKHLSADQIDQIDREVQEYKDDLKFLEHIEEYNRIKAYATEYAGRHTIEYAEAHLEGKIAKKDIDKAIAILEDGGQRGYLFAYNKLGNLYKSGDFGIEQNMDKALHYLKLGAKAGDSNCAHQVGDIYNFGVEGVKHDYVQAAEYFEMTDIKQGLHHAQAKYKVAYIYYYGREGVKQDIQKAYDLLLLASENGEPLAKKALEEWDFSTLSTLSQ